MRYIRKANLAMAFIVVGSSLYLGNLYGQRLAENRRDQCFRNLGMIEAGMEACALEIHSKIGDSLPKDKIRPYFKMERFLNALVVANMKFQLSGKCQSVLITVFCQFSIRTLRDK